MQGDLVAQLAMSEGILRDELERVAIGQLGRSQSGKLLFRWLEFASGGDDRFHVFNPLNEGEVCQAV